MVWTLSLTTTITDETFAEVLARNKATFFLLVTENLCCVKGCMKDLKG